MTTPFIRQGASIERQFKLEFGMITVDSLNGE